MRLVLGGVLLIMVSLACADGGGPGEDTGIDGMWNARIQGGFGQPPGAPTLICTVDFEIEIVSSRPESGLYQGTFPEATTHQACNNGFEGDWYYRGTHYSVYQDGPQVVFLRSGHADTFMTALLTGSRMTGRVHPGHIPDATFTARR